MEAWVWRAGFYHSVNSREKPFAVSNISPLMALSKIDHLENGKYAQIEEMRNTFKYQNQIDLQ